MHRTKVVIQPIKVLEDDFSVYPLKMPKSQRIQLVDSMLDAVRQIFEKFGGGAALLKSSKDVYIKPNGIDTKPYCYTRPSLLEAVIRYFNECGARQVYVFENSTQSNYTRIVFDVIGYSKICKRTGAKPIYLDEEPTVTYKFKGDSNPGNASGKKIEYDRKTFQLSKTVVEKIIGERDKNLYIDLPKLKTHSMAGVTLGVKNQWAFPRHADRSFDHNYNLHYKLVDVLKYVSPDFTIIDGMEGTIHGHYPPTSLVNDLTKPFRILIGGPDVVATDLVGARIFGLGLEDVPHLKLTVEKHMGVGVQSLDDIEVIGDLSKYKEKYPYDLIDKYPSDVKIISGKEMWCKEGCRNNPLTLLQVLYLDYNGRGGFTMVAGKGFNLEEIDAIEGKVFVAGKCAIAEVGDRLVSRLGKKHVYFSDGCNNLAQTAAALLNLMHVNPLRLVPMNPFKSIWLLFQAKRHHTKANVPSIFCSLFKTV
ncbi:MAG: DUF362 domain-containing protein [Promethearchaeota archaeon]